MHYNVDGGFSFFPSIFCIVLMVCVCVCVFYNYDLSDFFLKIKSKSAYSRVGSFAHRS